jgi:hypothetical protein
MNDYQFIIRYKGTNELYKNGLYKLPTARSLVTKQKKADQRRPANKPTELEIVRLHEAEIVE